jgi:regulator of sigma E protease
MAILAAVIVFSVIILFHEMGHFLAARYVGIEVEEFAIGFGPKILGFTAIGTLFSVRLLPLGGYVKMLGEEEGVGDIASSYQNKSPFQRMFVIAAGPVMNFILALLLFVIIFGAVGVYVDQPRVGSVIPEQPAAEGGIMAGDDIIAIDSQKMESWTEIQKFIQASQGRTLTFTVRRNGRVQDLDITPRIGQSDFPEVGIAPPTQRLSIGASITEGVRQTFEITKLILINIVQIFTRQIPAEDLTGPIGIVYYVGQAAQAGLVNVLSLAALISVNLGLFNLLPIPALDGSKIVFLGIELLRRRPLDPQKENLVHLVGFALLISLMIIVMYRDIIRFIM